MGRPYKKELEALEDTYEFSRNTECGELTQIIRSWADWPLISVGSGGALAVSEFVASLQEHYAERLARTATPMDAANSKALANCAVLFLSAGGSNPDVLGAFKEVVRSEPKSVTVLCGKSKSPLQSLASHFPSTKYLSLEIPFGKDGFLATNSVLAFATLLLRGYLRAFGTRSELPSYRNLVAEGMHEWLQRAQERTENAWRFSNLLILHGPSARSVAVDFESRFHEASLASVQLADFRNFAHGRHNWLAQDPGRTCVLAFVSSEDKSIAARTLALIPSSIQKVELSTSATFPLSGIVHLLASMHMAGWAAKHRRLDPGRPSVPTFGRRIYRLNIWPNWERERSTADLPPSVLRKAKQPRSLLETTGQGKKWLSARSEFLFDICSAKFGAIALDYDGTVCAPHERFTQPGTALSYKLNEILAAGLWLGIATGRGKSVREALQAVTSRPYWKKVLIGYYNGSQLALLSDNNSPLSDPPTKGPLNDFLALLKQDTDLFSSLLVEPKATQIKIDPGPNSDAATVLRRLQHLVFTCKLPVRAVFSTRSIDVVTDDTSKLSVVSSLRKYIARQKAVLCIGDAGDWPGNDFDLLSHGHSLSADSTSPDPKTCWNLAPVGMKGCDATLIYLNALKLEKGYAKFLRSGLDQA